MHYQTHQWMDTEEHVGDLFGPKGLRQYLESQLVPDGYTLKAIALKSRKYHRLCHKNDCYGSQWAEVNTGYCRKHSLKRDSLWKRFNKWRKTL